MSMSVEQSVQAKTNANRKVALACVAFFSGMVGLAYASVPLYELFCRVTGYGGTTRVADAPTGVVLDRTIKVRFDANTANGLGWDFAPMQREVEIRIGETTQIAYKAVNNAPMPNAASATFNVTPQAAGAFFNKMQCFCFTETSLEAGEALEMPVVFFVDPAIVDSKELENINTITLSYTFFPLDKAGQGTVETTKTNTQLPSSGATAADIRG